MSLSSVSFKPSDETFKYEAISRIESCIADTQMWVNDNFLKLIDGKTEFLIIVAQENIRYIYQGRWSVDRSKWLSTKKLVVLIHTLLNCVEITFLICIHLEKWEDILIDIDQQQQI